MKTLQPKTILLVTLITITVGCGYSSKMTAPVAGMMPTVSALSPDSATAGGAAFTMTVNGTNFAAKAVVNFNGTPQTSNTAFVSANQLTVAVPASAIASPGTISISVTNPATSGTGMYGGGGTLAETSAATSFPVN